MLRLIPFIPGCARVPGAGPHPSSAPRLSYLPFCSDRPQNPS